ncbi:MAG: substrate-binding domain-containing protein [Pseudomonadota bacterium]
MKFTIGRLSFLCWMILFCLFSTAPAIAQESLRVSVSSQVAEAYGKGILPLFEQRTGISVQLYVGPSETAIQRLENGVSDIAITTIRLPNILKESGYVEIPFCRGSIAVITNTQCTLTQPCNINNMSIQQLRDVFSGRISNWKDLGGPDQRIITFVPGLETGAYRNFKQLVMRVKEIKYDFLTYQSTMAIEGVRSIPGAISIVDQGALPRDNSVKIITVDGLSPTEKAYPIYQIFSFATRGTPGPLAQATINFGLSEDGIRYMKDKGMFPIVE